MVVALMGYMGSGKTTIGKALATLLNYNFLDLDDYISEQEQMSIPELFDKKGELYFRKKETHYLNEILSTKTNIVLALGGGTPCYGNNLKMLLQDEQTTLFYLKLSIPLLAKRLFAEREHRPLISHINSEDNLLEFIGKHLFERTQFYTQAQHVINTDHKSQKDIIELLLMTLI